MKVCIALLAVWPVAAVDAKPGDAWNGPSEVRTHATIDAEPLR
jgi:hypothetical protein